MTNIRYIPITLWVIIVIEMNNLTKCGRDYYLDAQHYIKDDFAHSKEDISCVVVEDWKEEVRYIKKAIKEGCHERMVAINLTGG